MGKKNNKGKIPSIRELLKEIQKIDPTIVIKPGKGSEIQLQKKLDDGTLIKHTLSSHGDKTPVGPGHLRAIRKKFDITLF